MDEFKLETPFEEDVHARTINFPNSVFIWVGDSKKQLNNLNISSLNPYSSVPSSTELLDLSAHNEHLANKLTKRLGKQVLLSFNLELDPVKKQLVEDSILQQIVGRLLQWVKNVSGLEGFLVL